MRGCPSNCGRKTTSVIDIQRCGFRYTDSWYLIAERVTQGAELHLKAGGTLVSIKKISGVDLVEYVFEVVGWSIRDYNVTHFFKLREVVNDRGIKKITLI